MIRLNHNPFAGSSLNLSLSFRDSHGEFYVPLTVCYSFLALNCDQETWQVLGGCNRTPIQPASQISLIIPNLKDVTGTTLRRKVLVFWQTLIDGQITDFTDEVSFDIQPLPVLSNCPEEPPAPTVYLQIVEGEFLSGTPLSAPTSPVILLTTNLPVNAENAEIKFSRTDGGDGDIVDGSMDLDSTKTKLRVYPNVSLEYGARYELSIGGLVSSVNSIAMSAPFTLGFSTMQAGEITLEELDSQVQKLQEEVERLSEIVGDADGLKESLDSLQKKVGELEGSVSEASEKYGSLESTVNELSERLGSVEKDVSDLKSGGEDVSGRLGTVEGDVSEIRSDISEIRSEISEVDDLSGSVEQIRSDLSDLESRVGELESKGE